MPRKADFSTRIINTLLKRASELCSNPNCQQKTTGPSSNKEKSVSLGRACHICAAQPNGPRYDPQQSEKERKSIDNAIWLCANCSDLVDKDPEKYSVEVLFQWKKGH